MEFGPVPLADAVGAVAAHAIRVPGHVLRKAAIVTADDIDALAAAGVREVVVARLAPGDVGEDEAAARLARACAGAGITVEAPFTGRANLFAGTAGLLVVDAPAVDAVNRIDEAVTLATLPAFRPVVEGEMVATVKVIPFAVPGAVLAAAEAAAEAAAPLVRIAPWRVRRVGVVSTVLPGLQDKVISKTLKVLEGRLAAAGAVISEERRVDHAAGPLAAALREMRDAHELVLVFGASAITDRRDVIPSAIEAAGGEVHHLGMPVDPGNLLLVGRLGGAAVVGAPGCARSPKENGFDWVLQRLLAGLPVTAADITAMGVGGLLMEIVSRPQPRAEPAPAAAAPRIAALVLAAGRGTRMGGPNKLMAEVAGKPLVRHAVEAALASSAERVVVVTGHEPGQVEAALAGLDVHFAHNPDFAAGLSTSLRTGLAALPPEVDGALVMLADMPRVTPDLIGRLIAAFDPAGGVHAAVPVRDGRRGNPVVLARRFFPELSAITGDVGARGILGLHGAAVAEVEVDDEGAFLDIDTPQALAQARNSPP